MTHQKSKIDPKAPAANGFKYKPQWAIVLHCTDEQHQKQTFEQMQAQGFKVKVLTV